VTYEGWNGDPWVRTVYFGDKREPTGADLLFRAAEQHSFDHVVTLE
jgi:hypothetical protein